MAEFSLPRLRQEEFSTFYNKKLERNDNITEHVIYPGIQLEVSSRSRNLKKTIKPENVFITKCIDEDGSITFMHKLYGNDKQWTILPKRLYSVCFPKIHLGSIPSDNRIKIQLTDNITVELPYVPDEFYRQKQQKASRPPKPVTRRNKRQRITMNEKKSDDSYQGWEVYNINTPKVGNINKTQLMTTLRSIMEEIDNKNLTVKNPFENVTDFNESVSSRNTLTLIAQYVYHYTREELNMQRQDTVPIESTLWAEIKKDL
tara:strand:+ start:124 stop:900 length:777 start_codon:yes stop_codon:yes gene_type:complete